ncbi:hypothetical protein WA026_003359 [Henosepilachna vigintioctopunctata]|uniref:Uncharacterized protein n=1 Tax=Henosepilachna vigintioctopunctata TaxID=420089 RepID=A0AAW1TMN7_9CUCU
MNYRVTLSIFLLFVHVHSAIIGGRSRREDEEKLQDEEPIQRERHKNVDAVKRFFSSAREKRDLCEAKHLSRIPNKNDLSTVTSTDKRKRCTRIFLQPSTAKYNYRVGSSRRFNIHANCQQCRRSQHCALDDNCFACAQYCKKNDQESFKRKAIQLEDDTLSLKKLEDPTFTPRLSDNSLQEAASRVRDGEIESILNQGDDTNTAQKRTDDQSNEQESNPDQVKLDVTVGSNNQLKIDEDCDQCRLSNHCEVDDICLPCIPLCKPRSSARIPSSEDELIPSQPNDDLLPVASPTDRTPIPRFSENSLKEADLLEEPTDENKSIEGQAIDDTSFPISRKQTEDERDADVLSDEMKNIVKMGAVNQLDIHGNCEECRHSQHCTLSDTCLQCAQYCKSHNPTSTRTMSTPEEENNIQLAHFEDRPLISRADESSLDELGDLQEIEDTNMPISRKHSEDERNAEELDAAVKNTARMGTVNQFEVHGNCEQCRHSQHCTVSDACLECAQYCKPTSPTSTRSMASPEEEIVNNPKNNILPEIEDNLAMSRKHTENQRNANEFHAGINNIVRMSIVNQLEIHENCEQCRHSQHCAVSDTCLQCAQYCKPNTPTSTRSMTSPEEEGLRNQPLISRAGENSFDESIDGQDGKEMFLKEARLTDEHTDESIDDTNTPISPQRFVDQIGSKRFNLDTRVRMENTDHHELYENCGECRNFHQCEDTDKCLQCLEYCKDYLEEVGIARDPENDNLPVENLTDRTLVSSVREDPFTGNGLTNDKHMSISRENNENELEAEDFDPHLVQKTNEEFITNQEHGGKKTEVENLGEEKDGSRYYLLGMINSGLFLSILSRLAGIKDHFDIRKNNFERAIIFVKSRNPIQVKPHLMERIGDSTFLKFLENEMNMIEKKQKKSQLTTRQINNIIQTAYQKAEEKYRGKGVVDKENVHERHNEDTLGCSHEQELPFYSPPSDLYRTKSIPWEENDRQIEITKPGEPGNSGENIETKQAKNPQVIQDNPNVESRSNAPKPKEGVSDSIALDSLGALQRNFESMNLVSSTKDETVKNGYVKYRGSKERVRNREQLSSEQILAENTSSDEESVEENGRARTFQRKNTVQDKEQPNINQIQEFISTHRHSSHDAIGQDSYENHKDLNKPVENKKHINKNINKISNSESYPGIHMKSDHDMKEHINVRNKNHPNARSSRIDTQRQVDEYEGTLSDQNNKSNQQSKPNHNLNNKKQPNPNISQDVINKVKVSLMGGISSENNTKAENGLPAISLRHSENDKNIKPKKYYQKYKYSRMRSSKQENEGMGGIHSAPINSKISSSTFDENIIKGGLSIEELVRKIQNSAESVESKETLDQSTKKKPSKTYDTDVDKTHQKPSSTNSEVDSNSDTQNQMQVANDNTEMNGIHGNIAEQEIISTDDQLVDSFQKPKQIPLNENQSKFETTKKTIDNNFGQATTDLNGKFDQHKRFRDIVNEEKIPLKNLDIPPKPSHFQSNQKMDLTNSRSAELLTDQKLLSKLSYENPKGQSISAAPAFGEKRKIEIDITNYSPSESHGRDNINSPLDLEPLARMNELETSKLDEDPEEIIGEALTESDNEVIDEKINKLITSQEREFLHNFGKIVPAAEKLHLGKNSEVYFNGNGIKLPLKVSQSGDGVLTLSVDIEKLCECKNATCSHKKQFLKQLDNNMGEIFHGSQIPVNLHTSKNMKNKRSSDPEDLFQQIIYQSGISKKYKRSVDESSNANILENQPADIKEKENNTVSDQNPNYKDQELKNNEGETFQKFEDLEKFKVAEKQLEDKLEKLNAEVQKSSTYYNNMLQKSTKDLLHTKGEDHVVKQRTELVNDLLKRMKEMADRIANFNKNTTTNTPLI